MTREQMQYRSLGKCGTKVSAFGLGGWTTYGAIVKEQSTVRDVLLAAFEAGVNFFDIADVYAKGEAERVMGKVLAELPRNELVISSKVFMPMSDDVNDRGLSRKHIVESIDRSLKRIGTDYLDIYFCHRFDESTPVEETARAMDDLVHQGKIIYWGTSEWTGQQLNGAAEFCEAHNLYRPQVEQPQYSLLYRHKFETDVLPAVQQRGMGAVMWSPLASGILTGKYDDGVPADSRLAQIDWLREKMIQQEHLALVRQFKAVADRLGCSRAQLALAWTVNQPGVSSVILGATSTKQLGENLAALDVTVDKTAQDELDRLFPCVDRS